MLFIILLRNNYISRSRYFNVDISLKHKLKRLLMFYLKIVLKNSCLNAVFINI